MAERNYAHRTTAQKLGIDKAQSVFILRAPDGYISELGLNIPESSAPFDFIQAFFASADKLAHDFPYLRDQLTPTGMLWISWPKKGSGIASDLNENIIRNIGLENGLVDVKVASINDSWSGLKFVYRTKDRP